MIHDESYVKKLIRKELEKQLDGQEAALLRAAWLLYDQEELQELELQVLRQLAGERPAGRRLDASDIIRREKNGRIRRLLATALRGSAAVLAVLAVVVLSYHIGPMVGGQGIARGGQEWVAAPDQIPPSEFACTVHWGDSASIPVHRASKGRLGRIGEVELWRHDGGELELLSLRTENSRLAGEQPDIRITTEGQQQTVVRLPDGVRIRLDAGSTLFYPLANLVQAHIETRLEGQALVQVEGGPERRPATFVLETANGTISTREGVFTVLANRWDTRAVLLEGAAEGRFPIADGQRRLSRPGDMVHYDRCCINPDGTVAMVLSDVERIDVWKALAWTAKTRNYRDVPLREFVASELERWNGIGIGSLSCIPEGLRITASVSYKTPVSEIYGHIRQAGVVYYEGDGMISFCGPELDPSQPQSPTKPDHGPKPTELLERLYDGSGLLAYRGRHGRDTPSAVRGMATE